MRQLTLFEDLILPMRCVRDDAAELFRRLKSCGKVIGTDEAGRGALAGPVVAAAVYLTQEQEDSLNAMGLKDSKRVSPNVREKLFAAMNDFRVLWRAYMVKPEIVDRDNVLNASLLAMRESVSRVARELSGKITCVVDGNEGIPDFDIPQWVLIRGDDLIPCVSAASVVAKVLRDRLMAILSGRYPGYELGRNKGYPTPRHIDAVRRLGLSDIHRKTFCRKIMRGSEEYQCRP